MNLPRMEKFITHMVACTVHCSLFAMFVDFLFLWKAAGLKLFTSCAHQNRIPIQYKIKISFDKWIVS